MINKKNEQNQSNGNFNINQENIKNLKKKILIDNNNNIQTSDIQNHDNIQLNMININNSKSHNQKKNKRQNNYSNLNQINSAFDNYDLQKLTYSLIKDYSLIQINKDEKFLDRMKFDIYKRQSKDERINKLIEENKKINQDKENLMLNIQEKENLIEEQIIGLNELKKNYKLINNDIKIKKEENKNLTKKISELEEQLNKEQKPDNDNMILNSLNATKENENLFKEAYEEIREKYRRLMQEQTKNISEIESKNEEIKNLKNHLKRLKKENNYGNEDIVRKYTEINLKKNYYKQQCKNANQYILKIFELLTNEQKQKLKNEGIFLNNFNNSESS